MKNFLDESEKLDEARALVASMPLDEIDVSDWNIFQDNTVFAYFERLRQEDPVHYHENTKVGKPYWSITKFSDIKFVDTHNELFSSEPSIVLSATDAFEIPSFLNTDAPKHDDQRKVVAPIVSPTNLANLEPIIRQRAGDILDGLPIGVEFDWVERVSIELTSMMLASLMNFPQENRHKIVRWGDAFSLGIDGGQVLSDEQRKAETQECFEYFLNLRNQRAQEAPSHDLVSMLAHGEATKDLQGVAFLANVMLLIIGGNDTTRNSISGSVLALNTYQDQFEKLKNDHSLVKGLVPEIVRWQTPLAHMMRVATQDVQLGGKNISKGDAVVMWYLSGNRDEEIFDNAHKLDIERSNARQHVAFGYGIHRCLGNRLAEMQLRILWEEILKRFSDIEVVGPAVRSKSSFIRGIQSLPVIVHK